MGLPLYLAMSQPEISGCEHLPKNLAYMACHFSPYNSGLSNFPGNLPTSSILILNDLTPVQGHDPELIGQQLSTLSQQLKCRLILLDLQRPENQLTRQIINSILSCISCPVAVSEQYAAGLECPVFVSAPGADQRLQDCLMPWKGREIWLEIAPDCKEIYLDHSGSHRTRCNFLEASLLPHYAPTLCCHYKIETKTESVRFILQRTGEDLRHLIEAAETLGVTGAVGLYQELESFFLL